MGRAPRFAGLYPSRAAALAALSNDQTSGYNDASLADVSFDWMCQRAAWDYPVLYWLKTLSQEGTKILDAGGHLGTKYIAFSDVWDVKLINWTVFDVPQTIGVAQKRQREGKLPAEVTFIDDLDDAGPCDILLASGLIQYMDEPFSEFVSRLAVKPHHIILNKVPLCEEEAYVTLERIGSARVPYQVRAKAAWQAEIDQLGYDIVDSWDIDSLHHKIATHPWHAKSESWGYVLRRRAA